MIHQELLKKNDVPSALKIEKQHLGTVPIDCLFYFFTSSKKEFEELVLWIISKQKNI